MKVDLKIICCLIVWLSFFAHKKLYCANLPNAIPMAMKGFACPELYGAMGDGIHDDTEAMQMVLDSLSSVGGGTMMLGRGSYLVRTLRIGVKTSIVGCGNGSTVIRQKTGVNECCLLVPPNSAALRIADLSILGNDQNDGIKIDVSTGIEGENHDYLYKNRVLPTQPYKWITIDNVCVYHFDTGLKIERWGWDINICNSTFSHNGTGVVMGCTDSSLYNCYIANNKHNGILVTGSNNKISNIKSIWNGMADAKNCGAIVLQGSRNLLVNCETQDNYCKGFVVNGRNNLLSNCMSNTDGYFTEPKQYNPSIEACGFRIKGLYNSFSNCAVTSYTDKYGAVFHTPIIVEDLVADYYPDIFENIKIQAVKDMLFFHEPYKNVETLNSKGNVKHALIEGSVGNQYFVSTRKKNNIIKDISCQVSCLGVLIDFKCLGENGQIVEMGDDERLTLGIEKKKICLKMVNICVAELPLDDDAVLNQDDMRLVVMFSNKGDKRTISLTCYEKTARRGWIKKEVRQDLDRGVSQKLVKVDVRLGDTDVPIKRFVITNTPLPESVFLPYSNTNRIYDSALVYIDADSYLQ